MFFYMGDNRGGDPRFSTSMDCTYFGPQPESRLKGTVSEIIEEKTAPQWFWDKVVFVLTFGIVKR